MVRPGTILGHRHRTSEPGAAFRLPGRRGGGTFGVAMSVPGQCETDALPSVSVLLARQAETLGDRRAFIFLPERGDGRPELSYTALHRRAEALAARLLRKASPGDRAVLLFPPGLDFVVAFYGCLAAGIVGVPLMLPRRAGARDA